MFWTLKLVVFFLFLYQAWLAHAMTLLKDRSLNGYELIHGVIATFEDSRSLQHCGSECNMDDQCVSISFSTVNNKCQLYKYDVSSFTVGFAFQYGTEFYKVACDRPDYAHVRSLNTCIKIHNETRNAFDARGLCEREGGKLMYVQTVERFDYLAGALTYTQNGPYVYYLGGGLKGTEWYWYTEQSGDGWSFWVGLPFTNFGSTFWGPGQPAANGAECMGIYSDGESSSFMSLNCITDEFLFICEIDMA